MSVIKFIKKDFVTVGGYGGMSADVAAINSTVSTVAFKKVAAGDILIKSARGLGVDEVAAANK